MLTNLSYNNILTHLLVRDDCILLWNKLTYRDGQVGILKNINTSIYLEFWMLSLIPILRRVFTETF